MTPRELTIAAARKELDAGALSAVELTQSVLDRISEKNEELNAYITVTEDRALADAAAADKLISAGRAGLLTGIPVALKDLICTRGVRTTCASRILENFVPPYNATVAEKLMDAGAVLPGKTNMDEFAMGSTNESSAFGPARNPWDTDKIPGGSSGGSAVAVAADMCLGALGSDTGGSIRQPASHCGLVGLKPTYGCISRFGLVAFASSLDQIGPMARTVEDCAMIQQVIAGYDKRDSTSVPRDVPDYGEALNRPVKGMKIGIPVEFGDTDGLDPEVSAAVNRAVAELEAAGAECVEVKLPHMKYAVAAYYIIATSEASSNLARYDAVKYGYRAEGVDELMDMYAKSRSKGFGEEVKRRILLGTYSLSAGYYDAYYGKALQVRRLIAEDFTRALAVCDVIAGPVASTPATELGGIFLNPLTMYLSDIFTLPANLAGLPGISVPCGLSKDGLPVGLQLIGGPFTEDRLFTAAAEVERRCAPLRKAPAD